MQAFCSFSTGLCLLGDHESQQLVNVLENASLPKPAHHALVCNVDDWELCEKDNVESLFKYVLAEHRLLRAALNIEQCFFPISSPLVSQLLSEVETTLQMDVQEARLLSSLMIAPLRDCVLVSARLQFSLSEGLGAVASVLDKLRAAQPHLSRLVALWLAIPGDEFDGYPDGRSGLWRQAARMGSLAIAVEAADHGSFIRAWNELVFGTPSTPARKVVNKIAQRLAANLFPEGGAKRDLRNPIVQSTRDAEWLADAEKPRRDQAIKSTMATALKQVEAIVDAVARGKDGRAEAYLTDLIVAQTQPAGNTGHVVKSLCNIAQRCAELFRTDFERKCLDRALQIAPNDAWLLTQFGDHLKRVGQYDKAVSVLTDASKIGDSRVSLSLIADVYAQRGSYDEAIQKYKAIAEWETEGRILMALADIMRRRGQFADARAEYRRLREVGAQSERALSGEAEIARREGDLPTARALYEQVLKTPFLSEKSRNIYTCSLIGILMRQSHYPDALRLADSLVEESPFFMQARVLRASALGLLGNAKEGVKSLFDNFVPTAFGEWLHQYVRGLLLLQLERFEDARRELIRNLDSAVLEEEQASVLRLAAAVSFLRRADGAVDAIGHLDATGEFGDSYAGYLAKVLRFHVAVARGDSKKADELRASLQNTLPEGALQRAFVAIQHRDFARAHKEEVRILLSIAA